jgi:hypothetical protein
MKIQLPNEMGGLHRDGHAGTVVDRAVPRSHESRCPETMTTCSGFRILQVADHVVAQRRAIAAG